MTSFGINFESEIMFVFLYLMHSLFDAIITSRTSNSDFVESDIESSLNTVRSSDISKNDDTEKYRQVMLLPKENP